MLVAAAPRSVRTPVTAPPADRDARDGGAGHEGDAALTRGARVGHHQAVGLKVAVGGAPQRRLGPGAVQHRAQLGQPRGGEELDLQPGGARHRGQLPELIGALARHGEPHAARLAPVRGVAGLLLDPGIRGHRGHRQAAPLPGGTDLPDQPGRLARGGTGQLALLDDLDIGMAGPDRTYATAHPTAPPPTIVISASLTPAPRCSAVPTSQPAGPDEPTLRAAAIWPDSSRAAARTGICTR